MMYSWRSVLYLGLAFIAGLGLTLGISLGQGPEAQSSPDLGPVPMPVPPTYERLEWPTATLHVVTVSDPQHYPVGVAIAATLTPTDAQAQAQGAIAAINAGFFDPNNGQTTSHGVVDGALIADPRTNQRLVGNPDLTSVMDQILDRSEFRRYACGTTRRYAITRHREAIPTGCRLEAAIGAGPQLLPQSTAEAEAFLAYGADGTISRDALGSRSRNARSAVGLKPDGAIVLVMVAQRPEAEASGLTFAEMTAALADLGVTQALNLDGGSSASLVFEGVAHYGRLDREGRPLRRPVKSILWVSAGTA